MAFSLDPATFIGNQIQGLIGAPVIIGLPSPQGPVPNFVIGIIDEEHADTSINLPAFQLSAGDLFMKSSLESGTYSFNMVLSQDPMLATQWISTLATTLQALSLVTNSIANYGAVLPNLSGISANYAVSQLSTLRNIKNMSQPILLLNTFITLGSISQNNPYLSSNWYIQNISLGRQGAQGGGIVTVTLKELLVKRDPSLTAGNLLTNFANEIIGPGVGSAFAGL